MSNVSGSRYLRMAAIIACIAAMDILVRSNRAFVGDAQWNEADHPRDADGKFGKGGGGGNTVSFTGNELGDMNRPMREIAKDAMQIAREKFDGKEFTALDGKKICVTWQGIKHGLSGDANPTKAIAATKLDEVIKNAEYLEKQKVKPGKDNIIDSHLYKTSVNIGGRELTIGMIVYEHKDGKRYYDHFEALGVK